MTFDALLTQETDNLAVITGGIGSGKTTLLNSQRQYLEKFGVTVHATSGQALPDCYECFQRAMNMISARVVMIDDCTQAQYERIKAISEIPFTCQFIITKV